MKVIKGFSGKWLDTPVDIFDSENGTVQMRLAAPITEMQQQQTIHYLIAEGFIEIPKPPKDDYSLPTDFGPSSDDDGDMSPL